MIQNTLENTKLYNPFNTAIKRNKLSSPTRNLIQQELISPKDYIIDYGCGRADDLKYLSESGFKVCGYDKYNPDYAPRLESLNAIYCDKIICNYVLNVLPYDSDDYKEVMEFFHKRKAENREIEIFIALRSDSKAIKNDWVYHRSSKGYWTSRNTFQRFMSIDDIVEEFGSVEFIANSGSFTQFKI